MTTQGDRDQCDLTQNARQRPGRPVLRGKSRRPVVLVHPVDQGRVVDARDGSVMIRSCPAAPRGDSHPGPAPP